MLAVVLQARLNSSRLPGKSLFPLGGKPLVLRVMEALNRVPADLRVLACPEDSAEAFSPLAAEAGFELFPGPRDDVLERYCLVIEKYNIDRLIRATGDNPFVFADAAAAIANEAAALNADYAGFTGDLPTGAGVESVSAAALLRARRETAAPFDHEHVCPYLYNNPEKFRLYRPPAPPPWQAAGTRITVDTIEDYKKAQILFAELDRAENMDDPDWRYKGAAIIAAYKSSVESI